MNLRTKSVVFFSFFLAGVMATIWLWWLPKMEQFVTDNLISSERRQLAAVGEMLTTNLLNNDFSIIHESLNALRSAQPDWRYIKLSDANGQEIFPLGESFEARDDTFITIEHTVKIRNVSLGLLKLVIDPTAKLAELRQEILQLLWVFGLIVLAALMAIIFFIEYFVSGPARKLSASAKQLAAGNYQVTVASDSRDEIGRLSQNFDRMRQNLLSSRAEREKARAQLQASLVQAENANQAKSNFLSTMSHEIRTPLNGVLGLAQLLIGTDLDAEQRTKVETILSSGKTLLAILNDILDISKIEAGRIELENAAFDLKNLISTVTSPFQSLALEKGVDLVVEDQIGPQLVVKGDAVRLRQVLWNLLSNAIKFTDSGQIKVTVERMGTHRDTTAIDDAHLIRFSFKDSGPGIASDRLDSIFDTFTQEDDSITRKHGGTGLGLAIVKQFSELMGGSVRVESQPGKGSTFTIELPLGKTSEEESRVILKRASTDATSKTAPLNVLVAEDNPVNAMITKAFLEKFGHRVKHVENGKLAVKAVSDGWVQFIFMDIHMPEMDGVDATKKIRATQTGKTLPIIGLTAEAFADRHEMFVKAGMNAVLTKPFTERQLSDIIAAHCGQDRRAQTRETGRGVSAQQSN